jgi:hypothetical protein
MILWCTIRKRMGCDLVELCRNQAFQRSFFPPYLFANWNTCMAWD